MINPSSFLYLYKTYGSKYVFILCAHATYVPVYVKVLNPQTNNAIHNCKFSGLICCASGWPPGIKCKMEMPVQSAEALDWNRVNMNYDCSWRAWWQRAACQTLSTYQQGPEGQRLRCIQKFTASSYVESRTYYKRV